MSDRPRGWSDGTVIAVAVGAIVLVMVGVGLASYQAGGGGSSTSSLAAPAPVPTTLPAPAPVDPQVAVGAHAFVQFACAQCHGDRGAGGVSPDVPALQSIAQSLTVQQLTKVINHGAGISSDPQRPFMPVWHGVVSNGQIAALIAYMKAGFPQVTGADVETIQQDQGDAVAGSGLYQRYGCVNCHGPNGLGGVPNPQSPDTVIPPLRGKDFHAEFNDQAIAEIIRSGSVIGKAPIVSMPHWGSILTDQQISQLVAYIDSLDSASGK